MPLQKPGHYDLELAFENVTGKKMPRVLIGCSTHEGLCTVKPAPKEFNAFVSRSTFTLKRLGDGESIVYQRTSLSVSTTHMQ
jgi:hypothetical protein